jgi:catechol 2,3-dioxygenase-like lactoylglutathione lyase family enzyme
MTLAIRRLNHIGFATDDFERTRALCEDVLGLEPVPPLPTGYAHYTLAWFRDRDGNEYHVSKRIADLCEHTGSDFNQSLNSHVAFEVESLEEAKAQLERHGFQYHELRGEGILSRKQLYVLLEDFGLMLELFETRRDAEPAQAPAQAG